MTDYVQVRERTLPDEPSGYAWLAPLREAVGELEYRDWRFTIDVESNGAPFLQIVFDDPGDGTPQYCRKWLLYVTMNRSEVVRTAWMAVMAAEEHEARERFVFMGRHIMAPHFDVDALVEFYRWRKNISPTPDPVPTRTTAPSPFTSAERAAYDAQADAAIRDARGAMTADHPWAVAHEGIAGIVAVDPRETHRQDETGPTGLCVCGTWLCGRVEWPS